MTTKKILNIREPNKGLQQEFIKVINRLIESVNAYMYNDFVVRIVNIRIIGESEKV